MNSPALISSAIMFFLAFQAVAADEFLTLREAATEMMSNNPSLVQRVISTDIAKKNYRAAQSAYLPRVDFVQQWNRSDNPVYVFGSLLNQQRFTEANFDIAKLNTPEALTDISSRFQLGWLLYDFGAREGNISAASSASRIAELQKQAVTNELLAELVRRYYGVALAKNRIEAAQDSARSATSRLEQATDRVEQGLAVQTDVLSAEVHLARTKQEMIDAENGLLIAKAALDELIGGAIEEQPRHLTDREFPIQDLNYWITEMIASKPELKIAAEQNKLSSSRLQTARAQFLPSLHAWSGYEWHGDSFSYTGESWGAGVELKWNLFSGFSNAQNLSSAQLELKASQERQREIKNLSQLQLQSAFYRYQGAIEKKRVGAAAVKQAFENRRIFADRYESGLVSIQDSLQAESQYSESNLQYLQSIYDVYTAYASLLSAAGKASDIPTILEPETPALGQIDQCHSGTLALHNSSTLAVKLIGGEK